MLRTSISFLASLEASLLAVQDIATNTALAAAKAVLDAAEAAGTAAIAAA
jgi:hypothetical protein